MIRNHLPREQASRWARAHNPLQPPPLRAWHVLLGLGLAGAFLAALTMTGATAEVARTGLGGQSWQVTVLWIELIGALCLWAIWGVRAMHPLMYVALTAEGLVLALWLGITRTERLEFTVINALLLIVLTIVPVRIITRPNDTDRLNDCEQREQDAERRALIAEQERDEALAELARHKEAHDHP